MRAAVDCGQISRQTNGDFGPDAASQQFLFPDDVPGIDRLHCEQIVLPVLEQNAGNGASRQQGADRGHHGRLAPDPIEPAEPGRLGPQALPSLLDDERVGPFRLDAQDGIRDSPGEKLDANLRLRIDATG